MSILIAACVASVALAQDAEPVEPAPTPTPAAEPVPADAPSTSPAGAPRPDRPAVPESGGFEMSEEMKERLREAGIDPDSIGGGGAAGTELVGELPAAAQQRDHHRRHHEVHRIEARLPRRSQPAEQERQSAFGS